MVKVYYSPTYVLARESFDTTRKAKWVADSIAASPIAGIELFEPQPLTAAELSTVHDPEYVRAVQRGSPRELAESQWFEWDPWLWQMVTSSNGGAVAAARAALTDGVAGSLSSGLHHARRSNGAGYCTFNGLVLAARAALSSGARSVLILDLDAHCGGGTASLIADDPALWQIDVSVDAYDRYPPSAQCWLEIVRASPDYLLAIEKMLARVERDDIHFDLCIYNSGMDPFEGSEIGGLRGITREVLATRERMVFDWCVQRKLPVAFVLAGGYTGRELSQEELVALHRLTLAAASSAGTELVRHR